MIEVRVSGDVNAREFAATSSESRSLVDLAISNLAKAGYRIQRVQRNVWRAFTNTRECLIETVSLVPDGVRV